MRVKVIVYKDGETEPFRITRKDIRDYDDVEPALEEIEEFLDNTFDEINDDED